MTHRVKNQDFQPNPRILAEQDLGNRRKVIDFLPVQRTAQDDMGLETWHNEGHI
jgi:hypothetical protein